MGDHSEIQWTDATWNPVTGCTRASRGCDNCYAARQAAGRLKNTPAYEGLAVITPSGRAAFNGKIRLLKDRLDQPLRWKRPRMVFVNSMSDLFHWDVPAEFIAECFAVMAIAREHTFQVLTKRPWRAARMLSDDAFWRDVEFHVADRLTIPITKLERPLANVWIGTSVEDQTAADARIPYLLRTPAAVRFLSCEPLLGPVDLSAYLQFVTAVEDCLDSVRPLEWVIVGGESGPGARPMDLAWARSLVEQCRAAEVAVFVKQLGARPITTIEDWRRSPTTNLRDAEYTGTRADEDAGLNRHGYVVLPLASRSGGDPAEWPEDLRVREFPLSPAAAV